MDIKQQMESAQLLMNSKQLNKALSIYQSILEQQPQHLDALIKVGTLLRTQKKSVQALQHIKRALSDHPDSQDLLFECATLLREQGQFQQAECYYQDILKTQPQHYGTLMGLGLNAKHQYRHELALEYYQQAFKYHPENSNAQIQIANQLNALYRFSASGKIYQSILSKDPENFSALHGQGIKARAQGDHAKALTLFKKIGQLYPNKPQIQLAVATELCQLEQFEEAITFYQIILAKQPEHFAALLGLAQLKRRQDEREVALDIYKKLQACYPDHLRPQLEIATELREQGHFTDALERLLDLTQQFPYSCAPHLHLGNLYRQQNQHQPALAYYQAALALHEYNPQIKLNIATEQFVLGDVSSALATTQQLLKLQPQDLNALLQLGDWLMIARTFESARDYFQQAVDIHRYRTQPYIRLAHAFLELGETEKCFNTLESAQQILGEKVAILHAKASILWSIRQINRALATQEQGLALFPNNYPLQLQAIRFHIDLGQFAQAKAQVKLLPVTNLNQRLKVTLLAAQISKEQGNFAEALSQYQAIIKKYPHGLEAHHALLVLALISMDIKSARKTAYLISQSNLGAQKINGQNRKYLHDHYAQLMDEYEINQGVLQQLHRALELDLTQRLATIAAIIIEEPNATSAATCFLAQLRQAHYFAARNVGQQQVIPKRIFQYWDKSSPPKEVLEFTQSWKFHNPDYEYRLFDERDARLFLQQHYPENVLKAYMRASHAAQRADMLRLALLNLYGGIYADADDLCLQAIAPLISQNQQLVLWQEPLATVGNNFIAVTPGHPVIKDALTQVIKAMATGDKDSIWLSTGPGLISRALAVYLAEHWPFASLQALDIEVISQQKLMNFIGVHGKLAYKSTQDSWLIQEFNKGNRFKFNL